MSSKIGKREREVLQPALIYGWSIEYDRRGNAKWEGDTLLPFRAHKTLDGLVRKGLMLRLQNTVVPTRDARVYECNALGCQRGVIYEEGADGYDHEVAKCQVCEGTGLTLDPRAAIAAQRKEG